jgi:hypothetical protein
MKLTTIIATRERPEKVRKTVEATLAKMSLQESVLFLAVDEDDEATRAALGEFPADPRLIISIKPREDSRGEKYDRALTEAPADVYLVQHDCTPIVTPEFDRLICEAAELYPDGIGCIYGPMSCGSFPALQAVTAKWVELAGHIYSHEYPFWFIDHELDDLARITGRFTYVPVVAALGGEHRPGTTWRMREVAFWTCYFDAMTLERRDTAHRIIDALEEPEWLKAIKLTQYPAVEARSLCLNMQVRASAEYIEEQRGDRNPPDAGYLRLRIAAETKLRSTAKEMLSLESHGILPIWQDNRADAA